VQVLTKEPDLSTVPVRARRLLTRCLERDPARRLRDIGDAAAWLEPDLPLTPPSRPWLWPLVAAMSTIAIAALAYGQFRRAPIPAPTAFRFRISLADAGVPAEEPPNFAFSPDGRSLAYTGRGGSVWLHVLGALDPTFVCEVVSGRRAFQRTWLSDRRDCEVGGSDGASRTGYGYRTAH